MAQTPTLISGETTRPIEVKVATAQAVTRGDLIAMISNTAVRAEDITWSSGATGATGASDILATQQTFTAGFVGVAAQSKLATTQDRPYGQATANTMRVDSDAIYEFDCTSATYEVGDLVGPAKSSGAALESQKVVGVAVSSAAIGSVAKRGTTITRVLVKLLSTLVPGGRTGATGATGPTGATGS